MHRKSSRFGCLGGLGGPGRPFQTKEGHAPHLADEGANFRAPRLPCRLELGSGKFKIGLDRAGGLGAPGDPSKQRRASDPHLADGGAKFQGQSLLYELDFFC